MCLFGGMINHAEMPPQAWFVDPRYAEGISCQSVWSVSIMRSQFLRRCVRLSSFCITEDVGLGCVFSDCL